MKTRENRAKTHGIEQKRNILRKKRFQSENEIAWVDEMKTEMETKMECFALCLAFLAVF